MSGSQSFRLKDVKGVQPIEKRGDIEWKRVYRFLSAIASEYVVTTFQEGRDTEVFKNLRNNEDINRSFKEKYSSWDMYDSMGVFLDSIDFQETEGSFQRLSENLSLEYSDGGWTVGIDGLSFPLSNRYLELALDESGSGVSVKYVDKPKSDSVGTEVQNAPSLEYSSERFSLNLWNDPSVS